MTCEVCTEAREAPESCRMFADYCLYCAARRIQYLKRVLFSDDDKPHIVAKRQARCRTALQQAIALGLPEAQIRAMAKRPEWQLAPDDQPARPKSGR